MDSEFEKNRAPGKAATDAFQHQRVAALDAPIPDGNIERSSLLVMVAALAGREFILRAYAHAIEEQYRFYSYGDCMLIR